MFIVKPLPGFTAWLDGLADANSRGVVLARIKRLERGLMGDVETVGKGVSELRLHFGPGWRVYFTQRGTQFVILLHGGTKRTQKSDIKRAQSLAAMLE